LARPGAFKSEKRKKEVMRLKKQEEKRQKRLKKDTASHQGTEGAVADSTMPEESAPEGIVKE
jgi:hypothetical protein